MAEESSSPPISQPPSSSMPTSLSPQPQPHHRHSPLPHFRTPHFPHLQSPLPHLPNLHSPHLPHSPRIRLPSITFDDLEYPGGSHHDTPSNRRPWIHNLHLFLDAPRSSTPALWYAIIMLLVIMASTTAFLVSSLPKYYNQSVFKTLQMVAGSIFTADYFLRVITADHWYKWILRPLSLVDAIVVVPFLISLVPSITVDEQFLALRAVRLLYILKIIRITSYVHMTRVVARTLKKSKDGFIVLLVGVVVMCLFFSTLIFIAENTNEQFDEEKKVWIRSDGVRSEFQSIFDGVWWCLVTFTTVGYGDLFPVSTLGKVVGVFTMFTGVLLTALPVAIFTANFTELWKERKYEKRADLIRRITTPDNEPKSEGKKKKEIATLLNSIEKEERHIAAAIQGARESIQEAHNSHKHMQLLLAQLRNSIHAYSSSASVALNLREAEDVGDEELEDFQRNSEQSSVEESEIGVPEES